MAEETCFVFICLLDGAPQNEVPKEKDEQRPAEDLHFYLSVVGGNFQSFVYLFAYLCLPQNNSGFTQSCQRTNCRQSINNGSLSRENELGIDILMKVKLYLAGK